MPLGVDALRVGLQIKAADAQLTHAAGGIWIQLGGQLHAGAPRAHALYERGFRHDQHRCQPLGHIGGGADQLGVIAREIEKTRMGPEGEALFIEGHQPPLAIHDRSAPADRFDLLGLNGAGPRLQPIAFFDLQPGQAHGKTDQACSEQQVDSQEPAGGDRLQSDHPPIGALAVSGFLPPVGRSLLGAGPSPRSHHLSNHDERCVV